MCVAGFVVNFVCDLVGDAVKLESVEIVDDLLEGVDLPDCDCELAALTFASAFDSQIFGDEAALVLLVALEWALALASALKFGSFNVVVIVAVALSLPVFVSVRVGVPMPLRFFFFFFFFLALRGVAFIDDATESGVRGAGFLTRGCFGVLSFVSDGDLVEVAAGLGCGLCGVVGMAKSDITSPAGATAAIPSPSPLPSAVSCARLTFTFEVGTAEVSTM